MASNEQAIAQGHSWESEHESPARRSLGSLFTDLARDLSNLVRREAELAKVEASEKTNQAVSGVVFIIIAAVILLAGLIILLEAAMYGISQFLPPELAPWLGAVIVGGVVALLGVILLMKGRSNLKTQNLMPNRTVESVRRDRDVAREHGSNRDE